MRYDARNCGHAKLPAHCTPVRPYSFDGDAPVSIRTTELARDARTVAPGKGAQ